MPMEKEDGTASQIKRNSMSTETICCPSPFHVHSAIISRSLSCLYLVLISLTQLHQFHYLHLQLHSEQLLFQTCKFTFFSLPVPWSFLLSQQQPSSQCLKPFRIWTSSYHEQFPMFPISASQTSGLSSSQ